MRHRWGRLGFLALEFLNDRPQVERHRARIETLLRLNETDLTRDSGENLSSGDGFHFVDGREIRRIDERNPHGLVLEGVRYRVQTFRLLGREQGQRFPVRRGERVTTRGGAAMVSGESVEEVLLGEQIPLEKNRSQPRAAAILMLEFQCSRQGSL